MKNAILMLFVYGLSMFGPNSNVFANDSLNLPYRSGVHLMIPVTPRDEPKFGLCPRSAVEGPEVSHYFACPSMFWWTDEQINQALSTAEAILKFGEEEGDIVALWKDHNPGILPVFCFKYHEITRFANQHIGAMICTSSHKVFYSEFDSLFPQLLLGKENLNETQIDNIKFQLEIYKHSGDSGLTGNDPIPTVKEFEHDPDGGWYQQD